MLCQHCQKNEASQAFLVNWFGVEYHIHLCEECIATFWRYASASGYREQFQQLTGYRPGIESPQKQELNLPARAGAEWILRRKLNALRVQLEEATAEENYEEAARLRDCIASTRQEAHTHES